MRARIILTLLGVGLVFAAHAQPKLGVFAEAGGCKLLGTDGIVRRLKEIAAQGSVAWDGQCKDGLIEGAGVLRQAGTETVGGKSKEFAVFYSGTARKGLRQGNWQRETFDRFLSSATFYTSAARLQFTDGVATGKPVPLAIASLDQLTPQFRKFVIGAQAEAAPANAALRYAPAAAASGPDAGGKSSVESAPRQLLSAYFPRVTVSSQYEQFGAAGLMTFQRPGWLSAKSPEYPQWVLVDFLANRDVAAIGILVEDGQQPRAPKTIRIEWSRDGKSWTTANESEMSCTLPDGSWMNAALHGGVTGRYLKIVILGNCGDPDHVTLRGLRFY